MTEGLCLGSSVEGPGQGPACIRTEAARAHLLCASCLFQLENPLRNCSDCISATRRCVSGMGVCVLGLLPSGGAALAARTVPVYDSNLVDPASSHTLV